MGTRSLVTVERNGEELITLYRHWDGYPSVAGRAILEALRNVRVVNGRRHGDDKDCKPINGIGRLACELIAKVQNDAEFDVMPTGTRNVGEEYIYTLYVDDADGHGIPVGRPMLKVISGPMTMFGHGGEDCINLIYDGLLDDFNPELETEAA